MVERKSSKEEKLLERNCEKEYSKENSEITFENKIHKRTFECTLTGLQPHSKQNGSDKDSIKCYMYLYCSIILIKQD